MNRQGSSKKHQTQLKGVETNKNILANSLVSIKKVEANPLGVHSVLSRLIAKKLVFVQNRPVSAFLSYY